jgi:siroheme synthase-like protein
VVSALDDRELNESVAATCRRARVPVNVVDDHSLCDFTMPAVAARGSLMVAISSSGLAPFISASLRRELQPLVDQRAPLVSLVARLRARGLGRSGLARVFRDPRFRRAVAAGNWPRARLEAGRAAAACRQLDRREA